MVTEIDSLKSFQILVYIYMYAAYDIRRPICDGEFFFNLPNFLWTFI